MADTPSVPESVPDDAMVDLPPDGASGGDLVPTKDPEAEHRRGMDKTKLIFAIWMVGGSIGIVVTLSVIQYVFQEQLNEAEPLDVAIDWLKIIATTALGFIFGRTLDKRDSSS